MTRQPLTEGAVVRHPRFGSGTVLMARGETAVVRFEDAIHECEVSDLATGTSDLQRGPLVDVVLRIQAEAIVSTNDAWGVFSRSNIALLPHQLWVCRKVNESFPTFWLVADDVGLGKTIEAGLVLMPLLSRGVVKRLLVLCPASLVVQWQTRLLDMFDIRLAEYASAQDTTRSRFWDLHDHVVASFHTLRADRNGRHDRLFASGEWDMVIVDEAHHLNYDEKSGPTGAYLLLEAMSKRGLIGSMLFFTGTPHRGKPFGFISLLQLLRPDLFNRMQPAEAQIENLRDVLIRNNKYTVTDLKGQRLFQHPAVTPVTYAYSPEEEAFYNNLTDFIATGRAYASGQSQQTRKAVMLVLIAMQKLAASSVAAIRRAIAGRLERIDRSHGHMQALSTQLEAYEQAQTDEDDETSNALQEQLVAASSQLALMDEERTHLRALLTASEQVGEETKIGEIVQRLDDQMHEASVVFFTEYKATQSLLLSALIQKFGDGCATFINGDDRAEGVVGSDGREITLRETKSAAAERFNAGTVRFLVSTEAGGEGIDLQSRCHTLVHVDLPWNPMRMQQRVGRLNRYGQRERVDVYLFHNPDTVESRIWQKLDQKLNTIITALGKAMDEPEDLKSLILGLAPASEYRALFEEAQALSHRDQSPEKLSQWFDSRTGFMGGRDAVQTVRELVGQAQRFDFQQISSELPQCDLPDLEPFFVGMLEHNHRRVIRNAEGLSFKTPDAWLTDPGVRPRYENLVFDRGASGRAGREKVIGVGHRVVDQAIAQARALDASLAVAPSTMLPRPLVVFRVRDRVTAQTRAIRSAIMAVEVDPSGECSLFRDWVLLQRLNALGQRTAAEAEASSISPSSIDSARSVASFHLAREMHNLGLPFRRPEWEVVCVLWPDQRL